MKILNSIDKKLYYEQETEKARQQMIQAIKEKDLVLNEIKEQRIWVNKTVNVLNTKEAEKANIIKILSSLELALKEKREFFIVYWNKYKESLDNIVNEINILEWLRNKGVKELDNIKEKIQKVKIKSKDKKDLQNEIIELQNIKTKLVNENLKLETKINKTNSNILKEKEELNIYKEELNKKEDRLNRKEMRLKKLEQKLFINK